MENIHEHSDTEMENEDRNHLYSIREMHMELLEDFFAEMGDPDRFVGLQNLSYACVSSE